MGDEGPRMGEMGCPGALWDSAVRTHGNEEIYATTTAWGGEWCRGKGENSDDGMAWTGGDRQTDGAERASGCHQVGMNSITIELRDEDSVSRDQG